MILQTGGFAWADIMTRSKPLSYACSNAFDELIIPSVSPSGPIRRTSFAVICSLSRVSLSFALIVQHLQTKNPYKDRVSARHTPPRLRGTSILTEVTQSCRGESGALCFVLLAYYTTDQTVCQVLFLFFSKFFSFAISSFWCDIFVYGKTTKKFTSDGWKFLHCMFFHKKIRLFSSQLNIYKSSQMRYNIYAVGNRRQVPFVAHCKARTCEMSIS